MFFRLGFSKEWEDEAIIAVDLVTGFMNRFHSSSEWRLSIGTEISRFKNQLFRGKNDFLITFLYLILFKSL